MELLYVILCFMDVVTATYITNSTISTDYTFSVTDSPYYIHTYVTFTKNVLIENGAEIIFPAAHTSQLIFYGNVSAGCNDIDTTTNNDRGLMDSTTYTYIHTDDILTSPTGFITINTQHPANTILEFCNVKFYGMQIAMKISTPHFASIPLLIDNCEFDNNNYTHYFDSNAKRSTQIYISDSIISNTTIVNSDGNAMYDNCDVNNYDTFCKFRCTKIAIRNSKLSRNTADTSSDTHCIKFGANAWWGAGDENFAFYNNFISDCGIAISYVASKYIINNTFSNIHGQVIQLPYSTPKYELFVINNTFINNHLHSIFHLTENILHNITVKGNQFINNIASDNSLIYLSGFVHYGVNYLLFEDNIFTLNQAANRLITIHIPIIDFMNNIFVNNIAGVASVSTVNDIISDNAAIYFDMDSGHGLPSLILRSNTFQNNKWNAYFIYTKQIVFQSIIIQYNLFNDTHIGPTAKLLSVGRYAYTGSNVIIQYNTFIPPTSSSLSSVIDKISSYIANRRIQYNNFYNAFTSTFFIETSGRIRSATEINYNYFDGLSDVNAILNKINPNAIGLQCQVIQPFYKDPIDMYDIANLPSECVLDSVYSSDCSYNGNIIGCITQSPTRNPTIDPTIDPTINPSIQPSYHPSQTPTNNPTINPTISPTINPSIPPTLNPTWLPTQQPTSYPSNNPSSAPSYQPSSGPSIQTTKISSTIYTTNEDLEIENTNDGNTMKYLMAVVVALSITLSRYVRI